MGCGAFVGLADSTENRYMTKQQRQCRQRHGQGNKRARAPDHRAKRVDLLIHSASYSWNHALAERRPKRICPGPQVAVAVPQKRLKLGTIPLSPGARI